MNKIHHKTLEAQKRREAEANADVTQVIAPTEVAPDTKVLVDKDFLDRQNAIIESLALRMAQFESTANAPKKADISKSKIYEGPLTLSYYLFNKNNKKVPIVDYHSEKKHEQYSGMSFKNVYGQIESNQIIVVTLADGDTKEVDSLYLAEAEASEPQVPKFVIDKQGMKFPGNSESIWAIDDQKRRNFLRQISAFVFDWNGQEITIPMNLIASTKTQLIES